MIYLYIYLGMALVVFLWATEVEARSAMPMPVGFILALAAVWPFVAILALICGYMQWRLNCATKRDNK